MQTFNFRGPMPLQGSSVSSLFLGKLRSHPHEQRGLPCYIAMNSFLLAHRHARRPAGDGQLPSADIHLKGKGGGDPKMSGLEKQSLCVQTAFPQSPTTKRESLGSSRGPLQIGSATTRVWCRRLFAGCSEHL